MTDQLYRERLCNIRARVKWSAEITARKCGYATKWSYSRYEQPSHGRSPLPTELIRRLIPLWVGLGSPTVTRDELIALCGPGLPDADYGPSEAQGTMAMAVAPDKKITEPAPLADLDQVVDQEFANVRAYNKAAPQFSDGRIVLSQDPSQRWEFVQGVVRDNAAALGVDFNTADRLALRVLRRLLEAGLL